MTRAFPLARTIVLSVFVTFSFIVFCLAIDLCVHGDIDFVDDLTLVGWSLYVVNPATAQFSVFVALLSLLVAIPGLAFRLSKRAHWYKFLSLVWVELCWTVVLAVLWFSSAVALTVFSLSTYITLAANELGVPVVTSGPYAVSTAAKVFAWLNWLLLFGYGIALVVCSLLSLRRGSSKTYATIEVDDILLPPSPVSPVSAVSHTYPPMSDKAVGDNGVMV